MSRGNLLGNLVAGFVAVETYKYLMNKKKLSQEMDLAAAKQRIKELESNLMLSGGQQGLPRPEGLVQG